MMCLTARQQLKYAAMAQETFSQHVPGAQGLKGPPVCIIMSGSANANVTVANPLIFQNISKLNIYIQVVHHFSVGSCLESKVSGFQKEICLPQNWGSGKCIKGTRWTSLEGYGLPPFSIHLARPGKGRSFPRHTLETWQRKPLQI